MGDVAKVAVLGASGYTGAEVMRLCALHPNIEIAALTGDRAAGKVCVCACKTSGVTGFGGYLIGVICIV